MFNSKCLNLAVAYMTVRVTLRFLRLCVCMYVCVCTFVLSMFASLGAGVGYAPAVACSGPRLGLSLYYFHLVRWTGCAAPEPAPISENRRLPSKSPACHEGVFQNLVNMGSEWLKCSAECEWHT